jgi:hypothetical protein
MYLASAYPNSALSAGLVTVIALVTAGTLAVWLGLVFLADRSSREKGAPQADSHLAVAGTARRGRRRTERRSRASRPKARGGRLTGPVAKGGEQAEGTAGLVELLSHRGRK